MNNLIKTVFSSPKGENYYFGYYSHSPLNFSNRYLLGLKMPFYGREILKGDIAEVGYFDLSTNNWVCVSETRAFNWQQGSMLQWIGPSFEDKFIFNDFDGTKYISKIFDISSSKLTTIDYPIYSVHPSGSYALSFIFERYDFCRAYSYHQTQNSYWKEPIHSEDGIFKIDLRTSVSSKVVSLKDVLKINPMELDPNSFHWLEQADWNKDGSKFRFTHRFGHGNNYTTRVLISKENGTELKCLEGSKDWSYTHGSWKGNDLWVIFASKTKSIGKKYSEISNSSSGLMVGLINVFRFLKRLIPKRIVSSQISTSGYKLINDKMVELKLLNKGMLYEDGHPSWTIDERFMLSDTYADSNLFRQLYLYDSLNEKVITLGSFESPINNTGYRCDLHPRFSFDNSKIIIDTAHNNNRQIMVFEIDWEKI